MGGWRICQLSRTWGNQRTTMTTQAVVIHSRPRLPLLGELNLRALGPCLSESLVEFSTSCRKLKACSRQNSTLLVLKGNYQNFHQTVELLTHTAVLQLDTDYRSSRPHAGSFATVLARPMFKNKVEKPERKYFHPLSNTTPWPTSAAGSVFIWCCSLQ